MNAIKLLCILSFILFFTSCYNKPKDYSPVEIETYTYPTDSTTINKWISNNNFKAMYKHSWYIWQHLTTPLNNGKLEYQTWSSPSQIIDKLNNSSTTTTKELLFKLDLIDFTDLNNSEFFILMLLMAFVLLLNLLNHLFLGDSGAYSLSFILGFILIKIYNSNLEISPYFIILLLWYPCFENLFSILRKSSFKLNPLNPDHNHLHQYLFVYLKKKI